MSFTYDHNHPHDHGPGGHVHGDHDECEPCGLRVTPRFWIACGLLLLVSLAVTLLARTIFFVDETEYVYVTQFGEPVELLTSPGLGVKWPYQSLTRFDRRLHVYEPPAREMLTEDKENLDFDWFVCWRIPGRQFVEQQIKSADFDPETAVNEEAVELRLEEYVRRYFQSIGSVAAAESRLEERIQAALAAEIGRTRLSHLTSMYGALQLDTIQVNVIQALRVTAAEQFGIEVVDVRLKRFSYPEAVKPAVFAEIRSERERVAVQYRAEGASQKTKIESQANLQRDQILAEARRDATRIRGEGEAKAIEIANAAHGKNPEFYELLKTLETYRTILDEQTTIVLAADSPLLKLLSRGLPEMKAPPIKPGEPSKSNEPSEKPATPPALTSPARPAGPGLDARPEP